MHEPSDGIAEEVERQLQLALAAAAIAARRAIAARQHAIEQAQTRERTGRPSGASPDRRRAAARGRAPAAGVRSRLVGDRRARRTSRTCGRRPTAGATPTAPAATPTIFDHAAGRIRQEVRDRSGLDPTQVITLAAVQELEHEHQATLAEHADASRPTLAADRARRAHATWLRRSAAPRAAPRAARRRRRARAGDRGTDARRPRPSPRGRRGGTHAPHHLGGAAPRCGRSLGARAHAPTVSAAHRHRPTAAPSEFSPTERGSVRSAVPSHKD